FLVPFALSFGAAATGAAVVHAALAEYIPFIILLTALFTVAGGIHVRGNLRGSPGLNTAILAIGAVLASFMGTTGASMLLIRPLIRANDDRKHQVHVVVFFIFIVSNAGGSLTPLGDPPLFLGFLKGVDFFWTTTNLAPETLLLAAILLPLFFVLDSVLYAREGKPRRDPTPDTKTIGLVGLWNVPLLIVVIAAILMSGLWNPGISFTVYGTELHLQNLMRDAIMVAAGLVSLAVTRTDIRERNAFNWEPIKEVAKLFAAIFATLIPVIAILKMGLDGAAAPIVSLVTDANGAPVDRAYFWMTGLLSGVLDNAPTYLVFFNMAGGDAQALMTTYATTLAAISGGAVFMGALTYIGNAPNFMVLAIAKDRGVAMPSFFGYMAWSIGILIPCFILLT